VIDEHEYPEWTKLFFSPTGELNKTIQMVVEPGYRYKHRICGAIEVPWW
jgi:hypothetical protein